jgi:Fur family transcriptional regulator, stress-responsive regulator
MSTELLERLRTRGWRMTPQRRTIAEVLGGNHVHLTAEEILDEARARLPEVSLTTVYNTLHELVAMGEVRELVGQRGSKRYDPNVEAHHHLRCVCCGRILDVRPEGAEHLRLPESELHGHTLVGVDIVFEGRCSDC